MLNSKPVTRQGSSPHPSARPSAPTGTTSTRSCSPPTASCPPNQGIQWAFFGWVATVEAGAEIVFSARAAQAVAELADAEWVELGRATAELHDCGPGGPLPDCPCSLFDRLGLEAREPFVELEAALATTPSAAGRAVLEEWLLSDTCVDDR